MGNPLAVTDPRGFTTRYDRNELGKVYRAISPQPYNFRVETSFDANRNVTRVDTEDLQPAFDSSDPSSALSRSSLLRAAVPRPTCPCSPARAAPSVRAGSPTFSASICWTTRLKKTSTPPVPPRPTW